MGSYEYTMGKELDLKGEQQRTSSTPRLKPNLILKMMFITFDLVYGAKRTLPKFLVLEILARYPYWAWENGGYQFLSNLYSRPGKVDPEVVAVMLRHIEMGRESQDNEQYHMLLLADIIHQKGIRLSWFKHFLVPRTLAFVYFWLTKIMYKICPWSSFAMNAAFESHAEGQYMKLVEENPQWEEESVETVYFDYYPRQRTLSDLLRRIGLDERDHMNHSLEEVGRLKGRMST